MTKIFFNFQKFFGWFVTFLKSKGELTSIEEVWQTNCWRDVFFHTQTLSPLMSDDITDLTLTWHHHHIHQECAKISPHSSVYVVYECSVRVVRNEECMIFSHSPGTHHIISGRVEATRHSIQHSSSSNTKNHGPTVRGGLTILNVNFSFSRLLSGSWNTIRTNICFVYFLAVFSILLHFLDSLRNCVHLAIFYPFLIVHLFFHCRLIFENGKECVHSLFDMVNACPVWDTRLREVDHSDGGVRRFGLQRSKINVAKTIIIGGKGTGISSIVTCL